MNDPNEKLRLLKRLAEQRNRKRYEFEEFLSIHYRIKLALNRAGGLPNETKT